MEVKGNLPVWLETRRSVQPGREICHFFETSVIPINWDLESGNYSNIRSFIPDRSQSGLKEIFFGS